MSLVYHLPITESASLTDVRAGVTLACTRASTHAMTDDDGWLREVQANEAAFEGARFRNNLAFYSEQLSEVESGKWDQIGITTVTNNATTAPDGTLTADKIGLVGTSSANKGIYQLNICPNGTGHTYVFSVYAKAAEMDSIAIRGYGLQTEGYSQLFDLTNGVLDTAGSLIEDAGIEDVGDGWYRCWTVVTGDAGSGDFRIYAGPSASMGSSGAYSNFTNTNGDGVYLWGAQAEEASGRWDGRNELTRSNDMNNAVWTHSGSLDNMTVGTGTLPNSGPTTYWEMEDWGSGSASSAYYNNVVLPYAGRYIFSGYVRKNSGSSTDFAALSISNLGVTTVTVSYDLTTGATNIVVGSPASYGSEDVGNGWWRIWIEYYANSSDLNGTHWVYQTTTNSSLTYTRDGSKMDVAGFQTEPKKPNVAGPSVYVGTDGAADVSYSPSTLITTTTVAVSNLVGANSGLHDWPAATNICLQSEDFSTTWTAPAGAVTANQALAPDGSLTADLFKDDELTGTGQVWLQQSVTVATASQYTFSCFLKADQLSWAFLELDSFTTPASNVRAWFDLATGAVGTVNGAFDDSGIEDYGNGWYRCWVVFTTDAADTTGTIEICVAEADNDFDVTKDGTSSIFVWGAQVELASRPSPYIRTTTGTATRSEPDHSSSDVSWFNEAKGSIVARGKAARSGGFLVNINKDAAEYHAAFNNSTTLQYRAFVGTGTDVSINAGGGELANYASATIAAAYEIANYTASVNGVAGTPNTTNNIPASINEIRLGNDANGSNSWGGLIEEVAVFDNYLTQDQLDDVSAGNITVAQLSERRASLARTLTANLTRNLARGLAN